MKYQTPKLHVPAVLSPSNCLAPLDRRAGFLKLTRGSLLPILLALGALVLPAGAQSIYPTPYTFNTLAGLALVSGSLDGTGSAARFNTPLGVAVDSAGNLYVADTGNQTIRKVTPTGVVTTLAGLAGVSGTNDGTGSAARFKFPNGLAVDSAGNLYVADALNYTIRKVTPVGTNWVVTTLAGLAGSSGSADGTGSAARFNQPAGVAVDSAGNLYVADGLNYTIRKVTPTGVVTTLAGLAGSFGTNDGTGSAARFNQPAAVAVDSVGNLYVADTGNQTIRKVTPTGVVTTLAGLAGSIGSADGTGSAAQFHFPEGVAVDSAANVFVADSYNYTIRKVTPTGVVTTLAGLAGSIGSSDGTGSTARFFRPTYLAVDSTGNLYVADTGDLTIRKGSPRPTCVPAPTNMVLWLPFDETNGTTSANLAPGGNNGTQVNGPVVTSGFVAHSLSFDGVSQYVEVPSYNAINFGTNDFSIDAWVRRATNDTGTSVRNIVDKRVVSGAVYTGFAFYLTGSAGSLGFDLADGSGSYTRYTSSLAVPNDQQWHHVALTVNRTNTNGLLFYHDGVADSVPGNPVLRPGSVSTASPLRVGSQTLSVAFLFSGSIDEVELFNRVLAPAEIAALFNAGSAGKCKPPCATEITVTCPTNKTVQCGTNWKFDLPSGSSCCESNVTVTVAGTVTNGVAHITFTGGGSTANGFVAFAGNTATSGYLDITAGPNLGTYLLSPGSGSDSYFNWDGMIFPAADPFVDSFGLLFTGDGLEINLFGNGPGNYSLAGAPPAYAPSVTNGVATMAVCPQTITRTWLLTDACGNSNTCSQTVTVVDNTPPVLNCSSNKIVLPGSNWSFDPPVAVDACSGTNVTIVVLGTVTNGGCSQFITRTWLVTDACGNSNTCSQTVSLASPPAVLSLYDSCGDSNIVIGFSSAVTPASALNIANYQVSSGGKNVPILNATISEDAQIVTLVLSASLPPGVGGVLAINGLQDACGNTIPGYQADLNCTASGCAFGNAGTEFWLTFPGNYAPDTNNPPQLELYISGSPGVIGTVAMPGIVPPFISSFTIPASGMVSVALPSAADLGDANDMVETNGIHVVADGPVTIDAFDHVPYTTDAYLGLPTRDLGYTYLVMAYKNVYTSVPDLDGTQFAIAATAGQTTVTIVPTVTIGVHAAGVPFNVSLMKGQTYQLRDTNDAPADLTGTAIVSDKPVAVFGSHRCAGIPSANVFFCDYLVQQLFPVPMWGTNYLTVPLQTRLDGDTFRCLAWQTNTTVYINGIFAGTINSGQLLQVQLTNASQITATAPILLAQYADSSDYDGVINADPLMVLIPPTTLYGTSYQVVIPSTNYFPSTGNYLNVVMPTRASVLVDGVPMGGFTALGTSGYSWAQLPLVNTGLHTVASGNGAAIGVTVYGWSLYDAYGYPAGICAPAQGVPPHFSPPPTNTQVAVSFTNNMAVVPDLRAGVSNASAAFMITQVPQPGSLVGPGSYPVNITVFDEFGGRYLYQSTLTVTGQTSGKIYVIQSGGHNITLTWANNALLQSAGSVSGPWTTIQGSTSPYVVPITNAQGYFRTISQ